MHAALTHRYAGPDAIELADIPAPRASDLAPDEVLLRVEAAPIHRGDWHLLTGRPYLIRLMGFGLRRPKQPRLGLFACGRVEAVGSAVEDLRVGDRVHGNATGGLAEFAVAKARQLVRTPDRLSSQQAAALPNSGCTAAQAIASAGGLREGQRVLVLGATGSVGALAVQIAKAKGAQVDAVCSSRASAFASALGADRVFPYDSPLELEQGTYDLILDTAARMPHRQIRELLRPEGRCVMIALGHDRLTGGILRGIRSLIRSRFSKRKFVFLYSEPDRDTLEELNRLVEGGQVTPTVAESFEMRSVPSAFTALERGGVQGTIVISVRTARGELTSESTIDAAPADTSSRHASDDGAPRALCQAPG